MSKEKKENSNTKKREKISKQTNKIREKISKQTNKNGKKQAKSTEATTQNVNRPGHGVKAQSVRLKLQAFTV